LDRVVLKTKSLCSYETP